jgi:hypothetical protein
MLVLCQDWRSEGRLASYVLYTLSRHLRQKGRATEVTFSWPYSANGAARTNLDIVSYSAASKPASKENRILAFSVPFGACAARFPVLRFL